MAPPSTSSSLAEGQEQEQQQQRRFYGEEDYSSDEDMEALRRARLLAGIDASRISNPTSSATATAADDSDSEDDEELVRSTLQRCGIAPLSLKPLSFIAPPESDGEEDEYELLCAIRRRFAAYDADTLRNGKENDLQKHQQVRAPSISSEKETSSNLLFVNKTNYCKGCPDSEDAFNTTQNLEVTGNKVHKKQPSDYVEGHQSATHMPLESSSFPKAAQAFIDAIKKNRSCQKLLRSKLIQIEAKLEANKKLRERVKILKDFQISCKRKTGRALSQKDPLVQLILVPKVRASKSSKVNNKKVTAMCYGPAENAHVANYRMALTNYPLSVSREKWSKKERENLEKGIKQQFQQMSFQMSMDLCSGLEGSFGDSIDLDAIMTSIADFEITPEHMKLFLPKVNWEQLASMYVAGRSGAECEARWLNCENPLINHGKWTTTEDRNLLHIVKERGYYNWMDTAMLFGTNRTPFQCLARFQRSLNTYTLKSQWRDDEDAQLCKAVQTFGEGNWQLIASALEGRTGTQCSNRWKKTLHPMRKRVGRWTQDEDKYLKVAVRLFGPKTWNKIAQFVPGRTQVQCRERWVNSLDPSLKGKEWTDEEISRLDAAIRKFGHCWSKVAKCVPPRTDSQCLRKWKTLYPHEVPLLQAARKIKSVALISNFVDRESERTALGPSDFVPLPEIGSISAPRNQNALEKQKKKSLRKQKSKENNMASGDPPKRISRNKLSEAQICPEEVVATTICDQVGASGEDVISKKTRVRKPCSKVNDQEGASGEDAIPRKKRVTKLCSKINDRVGTSGEDAAIPRKNKVTKPRSKTNNQVGTSVEDAIPRKKRVTKLQSKTNDRVGVSGEDAISGKKTVRNPHSKMNNQVEPSVEDATTRKKRGRKPHSKVNLFIEPTRDSVLCLDSTSLMITNDKVVEEIGASGGENTKNKVATEANSRRDSLAEEGPIVENDFNLDNERLVKSSSMENECTTPIQCQLPPCRDSALLMSTNGDIELLTENDATRRKLAPRQRPIRNKHNEVEKSGGNEAIVKKRRVSKRQPMKNKGTGALQDHVPNVPSNWDGSMIATAGVSNVASLTSEQLPSSNTINNSSCERASIDHHEDRLKSSCENQSCRDQVSGFPSNWDDGTTAAAGFSNVASLASGQLVSLEAMNSSSCERASIVHQEDRVKGSCETQSCSNQVSVTADDDMTLALFLKGKLKKRRLE